MGKEITNNIYVQQKVRRVNNLKHEGYVYRQNWVSTILKEKSSNHYTSRLAVKSNCHKDKASKSWIWIDHWKTQESNCKPEMLTKIFYTFSMFCVGIAHQQVWPQWWKTIHFRTVPNEPKTKILFTDCTIKMHFEILLNSHIQNSFLFIHFKIGFYCTIKLRNRVELTFLLLLYTYLLLMFLRVRKCL